MAVRPTIQLGHQALRAKNNLINDVNSQEVQRIIEDLKDTMRATGLIGMAAPQLAENVRIFVTEPRETATRPKDQTDKFRVYINQVIVSSSPDEVVIYEGCGSVMEGTLFGPVIRPRQVTIEALDERGQKFRLTADGILGRVIQHEYDHVEGKLFIEQVSDYTQMVAKEFYIELVKKSPALKQAGLITIIEYQALSKV